MESARLDTDHYDAECSIPQILFILNALIDGKQYLKPSLPCQGQQFPVLLPR
jgi:hypothetical protein